MMSNLTSVPIKIKLFDKSLPIPQYQTSGSVGFDLYSRLDLEIPSHQTAVIPLNIAFDIPSTHWLMIAARSSLHKRGLMPINGVGIGDNDYHGDQDEYHAAVYNYTDSPVKISRGERIYQGIILPKVQADFEVVTQLGNINRGGFGSTGIH